MLKLFADLFDEGYGITQTAPFFLARPKFLELKAFAVSFSNTLFIPFQPELSLSKKQKIR